MTAPSSSRIGLVAVVVPAHDEEDLLGHCLRSVDLAVARLHAHSPGTRVLVVVALDRCHDASATIASRHGALTVTIDMGNVGAARRAGVELVEQHLVGLPPSRVWLAHTDADTVVPPEWLVDQVDSAELGADLVIGRVRPDPADLHTTVQRLWAERHTAPGIAAHVHGANLGVRYDAYLAAGGFPPLAQHEDVALVDAMLGRGVTACAGLEVVTSGRTVGRVSGGFSGYLRDLVDESALAPLGP